MRPLFLVVVGLLVAAAPAAAATAKLSRDQRLIVTAAGTAEANRIVLGQPASGEIIVRDAGAPLTAGNRCSPLPDGGVLCLGVRRISVVLGDGDDSYRDERIIPGVTVYAGRGDDRIRSSALGRRILFGSRGDDTITTRFDGQSTDFISSGPGRDRVRSGAGRDYIRLRDGERDELDCSGSDDKVRVDEGLDVLSDCP